MKLQPSISLADFASTDLVDGALVLVNGLLGFCAKATNGGRAFVYLDAEKARFEFSSLIDGLMALSYGADLALRPDLGSFDPALAIGHTSKMEMVSAGGKFGLIVHLPHNTIRFYDFDYGRLTPWAGPSVAPGFTNWELRVERGKDEFFTLLRAKNGKPVLQKEIVAAV